MSNFDRTSMCHIEAGLLISLPVASNLAHACSIEIRHFSQTDSNSMGTFQYCGYNLKTSFFIKIFIFLLTAKYEDDPDGVCT